MLSIITGTPNYCISSCPPRQCSRQGSLQLSLHPWPTAVFLFKGYYTPSSWLKWEYYNKIHAWRRFGVGFGTKYTLRINIHRTRRLFCLKILKGVWWGQHARWTTYQGTLPAPTVLHRRCMIRSRNNTTAHRLPILHHKQIYRLQPDLAMICL